MNIGIIGAGMIGGTLAKLLVAKGDSVAIANSRGPSTLKEMVDELGPLASAVTMEDAAQFGDLVVVTIPLVNQLSLPSEPFSGRMVVDTGNYYPERDGQIEALDRDEITSSELFAQRLTGAKVVKAFNTIYYKELATQGDTSKPMAERRVIFVASDDEASKKTVERLIEQLGFGIIDVGALKNTRQIQPGSAVYNRSLTVSEARQFIQD